MAANKYDWTDPDLLQLMTRPQFDAVSRQKAPPPPVAWLPEVLTISHDVALQLIIKLDEEKRIMHDAMPWVVDAVTKAREEKAKREDKAVRCSSFALSMHAC